MNILLEALVYGAIAALISGTVLPLLYRSKNTRKTSFGLSLLSSVLLLGFAGAILYTGKEPVFPAIRYLPGLDFTLAADRLAAGFVLLIAAVVPGVSIYSIEYVEHAKSEAGKNLQAALTNLFILAMLMVVLAGNMVIFLIFWEIMSISSLLLVLHDYSSEENKKAGFFYFIMTSLSTAFLFMGFISLFRLTGSAEFGPLEYPASILNLPFICLFIGFGIKAGIVPFHKWLPYAHPAAPSSISALMSGVMLKVAIYGFLRFLLSVYTLELWWGILILIGGSLSAVLGVIYALKESDIKRLLAYSSIENIGIIFLGIGLYVIFKVEGLETLAMLSLVGACFHAFNHALFKSLLFLCAGSVVHATGTRNIEAFGGLVKRMPRTAVFFMIGSVSIAALPPTNGFVSELMLFQAYFYSSALSDPLLKVLLIITLSVFALTSALAAALFVKLFGITFLALPRTKYAEDATEVPKFMLLGEAIPAILCILSGLFSAQILVMLGFDFEVPDMLILGLILIGACGLVWFAVRNSGPSGSPRISKETWGCGSLAQHPTMEYTSAGFSEPLVVIFKKVYRTEISSTRIYEDTKESIFKSGTARIHLMKFFEEILYTPIAGAVCLVSSNISKMQNGKLDTYVLYVFIAVLTLMIFTRFFA
ncbi:proton-conducting transporter transmembrane domain-containing protein [Methanosarcina lacustris]|uniref:proton-conducting transporter transmembrane domain-containing protein n=1 Tax=Methanosarcina lacustris TaxID=170861 RepID=UPI001E29B1F3|nr:proton-conducting transporter membrane subunit [Methanosarcina lacustris]